MSLLARAKIVSGKMKLHAASEYDRTTREKLVQFTKDTEGQDFFLEVHSFDEISFDKSIPNYYRKIVLPALFVKMKEEYCWATIAEADATLSDMFLKKEMKKNLGNAYSITPRVEEISFIEQGAFLAKVANIAISRYGIRFPSAPEIQNHIVK